MADIINTQRLILRTMAIVDLDRLTEISTNPIVMAQFPPELRTPERARLILNKIIKQQKEKGYSLYGVIHREDNKLIGICGFLDNETDDGKKFIELGYRLDNLYWGKGYATEAALACRDYAFSKLKIKEFCSIILASNNASIAVARKIGMKQIDTVVYHGDECLLYKLTNG